VDNHRSRPVCNHLTASGRVLGLLIGYQSAPIPRVNSRNIEVNGLGLVIQVPPLTHGFVGQQLRALSRDSHLNPQADGIIHPVAN
jgi:hypothetical protein